MDDKKGKGDSEFFRLFFVGVFVTLFFNVCMIRMVRTDLDAFLVYLGTIVFLFLPVFHFIFKRFILFIK